TFKRWLRNIAGTPEASSQPPTASTLPLRASGATDDTPQTSVPDGQKSIAILPFRNLSGDPSVSFYEFSLADAVITELARLRSLIVRPSSLIVKYQGRQVDPLDAGREMSVGAILSANFLRAGDKLRVNAQLLDVETGDLLWSERIDASAADLIAVQDMIAEHIVAGLRLELTPAEKDGL